MKYNIIKRHVPRQTPNFCMISLVDSAEDILIQADTAIKLGETVALFYFKTHKKLGLKNDLEVEFPAKRIMSKDREEVSIVQLPLSDQDILDFHNGFHAEYIRQAFDDLKVHDI